jgi:hypothetical protein
MVGSLLRFPPSQRPFPFFIVTTLGGDHSLRSQPRASLTACIVMSLFLQFGDWSRRLLALQGVQIVGKVPSTSIYLTIGLESAVMAAFPLKLAKSWRRRDRV